MGTALFMHPSEGSGYNNGYRDGVQSEYDRFWDTYQNYGKRINYHYAFAGPRWTTDNFKPKYDIIPLSHGNYIFTSSGIEGDLVEILKKLNIVLDFSNATQLANTFQSSAITHIGEISTLGFGFETNDYLYYTFSYASKLHTIDKLILNEDGRTYFSNPFAGTTALQNITIEGTIGRSGWDMQWSTLLSKDSIISIINALSTTTNGIAITFSKVAVDNAFETSEGLADGSTSAEWAALANTKSNWTINLV